MTDQTECTAGLCPDGATGVLVLADGTVWWGHGLGREGSTTGEVVFCTGMTGYQETLTDPSFAGQIITFTFPHIGNTGTNPDDHEAEHPLARGCILRAPVGIDSSWRATANLPEWMRRNNVVCVTGIDTRALTIRLREHGTMAGVVAHNPNGIFNLEPLLHQARTHPSPDGLDLATGVSCQKPWEWPDTQSRDRPWHVVAIDFGIKHNILRCLAAEGCRITIVPAHTTAREILDLAPDGVFLSNGPGDPAATGRSVIPELKKTLSTGLPVFGICLGHQILALALGAKTSRMMRGHRGSNQPVKCLATGRVAITSQNHGFAIDPDSLPNEVVVTHTSLFDDSIEGIALKGRPVFSVQYHPESSPGPKDSRSLFRDFVALMQQHRHSSAPRRYATAFP